MNTEQIIQKAEERIIHVFDEADRIERLRTTEILNAFRKYEVSYRHFSSTTGYGYDDVGRDTLENA